MVTAQNILQHELIGLEIEVTKATNKSLEGVKGKIVDETQHTITIQEGEKLKKLLKNQITITTKINGQTIEIEGTALVGRPESRIKK